jgi:hypothetical protein
MNCRTIQQKFPDYLIGDLEPKETLMVQAHLTDCRECRGELEGLSSIWTKLGVLPEQKPSSRLRSRFYTMLEAYKQGLEQERPARTWRLAFTRWLERWWPRRTTWQLATAMLLLVFGLTAGYWLNSGSRAGDEIAPLRQEIRSMRSTLAMSLLDNGSASERLRGVNLSTRMEQPDARLLDGLLESLDNDPSINVRLAVVDALYLFADHPTVRERLSGALAEQDSPLVQMALIDLLVSLRERRAAAALKDLIESERLAPEVRQRARKGLERLL